MDESPKFPLKRKRQTRKGWIEFEWFHDQIWLLGSCLVTGTPLIRVAPNLFWIAMSRYARMIPTDLFCGGQHGIVAKQKQHSENSCKTSNNYNSKWYYCILLLVKFVSHFHTTSEYYQANCFWDFSSGALCAKTLFLSWAQRSRASGTWLPASLDGRCSATKLFKCG